MRAIALSLIATASLLAQDGDGDGLDDRVEQQLLEQFVPTFLLSSSECDGLPAELVPGEPHPKVAARNGTIYGQAFPAGARIELRFFHLWGRDCGRAGHALDAEHVSALLERNKRGEWAAVAWYAAAHEGTACDVGSLARAADLYARDRGIRVWVSRGKHASFLDVGRCIWGCGGDVCDGAVPLEVPRIVNIGEQGQLLNGATWVTSDRWALASKLGPDFDAYKLGMLSDTRWSGVRTLNVELRTAQAVFLGGDSTLDALALAGGETDKALTKSAGNVDSSLERAAQSTGAALEVSAKKTGNALRKSADAVGRFLGGAKP